MNRLLIHRLSTVVGGFTQGIESFEGFSNQTFTTQVDKELINIPQVLCIEE